jgi:hypothetical protein
MVLRKERVASTGSSKGTIWRSRTRGSPGTIPNCVTVHASWLPFAWTSQRGKGDQVSTQQAVLSFFVVCLVCLDQPAATGTYCPIGRRHSGPPNSPPLPSFSECHSTDGRSPRLVAGLNWNGTPSIPRSTKTPPLLSINNRELSVLLLRCCCCCCFTIIRGSLHPMVHIIDDPTINDEPFRSHFAR